MSEDRNLTRSFKKIWEQTSIPARITITGVGLLSIALMVAVGYWSMQPQYVPLANDLNPQEAAKVVSLLESEGIKNKRNFSGTGILVDQKRFNEANAIIASAVSPDKVVQGTGKGTWDEDPGTRETRRIRDLELRLEKTIELLKHVETATVHLGIPDPSPFVKYQNEKTASVTIKVRAGSSFSRKVSQAIILIVANGVDGLRNENISLQDTDGNSYSSDLFTSGGMSSLLEYRKQVEQELAQEIVSMLEPVLGLGNVVVRVAADIDHTKVVVDQKSFDPDSRVPSMKSSQSNTAKQNDSLGGGAAGSGVGSGGTRGRGMDVIKSEETITETYLNPETHKIETINPGAIKRLSVAVLVQLVNSDNVAAGDGKSPAATPAETMTREQVESLVKTAMGFDLARKDEIEVIAVDKLNNGPELAELIEPVAGFESIMPLIRNASLGIAAIVALILGFMTIKKIRPIEVVRSDDTAMTPQRARQLSDLAILARKNPDLVSSIMSAWINNDDETAKTATSGQTSARKAA